MVISIFGIDFSSTLLMAPKSIFRQPGAKHFQLVHRSQRDPLIHDPDAALHVLKPVVRENDKKACILLFFTLSVNIPSRESLEPSSRLFCL